MRKRNDEKTAGRTRAGPGTAFCGRMGLLAASLLAGAGLHAAPRAAAAQDLADFDYENLSFRGIGVSVGAIRPNKLEPSAAYAVHVDMGFLGPRFRLAPYASYWRSEFTGAELADLELRLADLVRRSQPGSVPQVSLGSVAWSDLALAVDAEYVTPLGRHFESFAGSGAALHVMRGSGEAIRDTFVEDLLNRITPGVNVHAGLAAEVSGARVSVQARWEIMDDLSYFDFRAGLAYAFGGSGE